MQDEVILNILILAYNHEKFIDKALNSVLEQKTTYKYNIFIIDDASEDTTADIINKIYESNKDIIHFQHNEKNLGIIASVKLLLPQFTAKYLTILDGDDYWCYDKKIQEQIDFLENNPSYSGCFHDAKIKQLNSESNYEIIKQTQFEWKTYSQFNYYTSDIMPWQIVQRTIIPTSSFVFRTKLELLSFITNYKLPTLSLIWALELEVIKNSKLKYFNETWSIYVDHPKGQSKKNSLIDFKHNNVRILENLLKDKAWDYYRADIYFTICNELKLIFKTTDTLKKPYKEYKQLLKLYDNYLKKYRKEILLQLKKDYKYYECNNRELE